MHDPPLILCCEDEPQLLRDICEELQAAGYRVASARDGAEMLAQLDAVTPDLVLCDIMMPGIDGYCVLASLRRDYPHLAHVPLIFLSALSMTEAVIRGKRAGADDYLVKPINYDLLLSTIEARLRQSTQARAGNAHAAGLGQHLLETLTVGMLIFTAEGALTLSNRRAQEMLAQRGPEIMRVLADPVRRLGRHAQAGREEMISLLLDEPPARLVQIHSCPPDAAKGSPAMVLAFLTQPQTQTPLSAKSLNMLFSLTPTEARVAQHLSTGLRPEDIAQELGVAPTTIAFHLRNLFAKTNTRRQAELVALLLSVPLQHPT
ncbi:MAG: response regulator [Pararhodobacter sp.]